MYSIDDVAKADKDIADLIEAELARIIMQKDIRGRDFTADVPV